MSEKIIQIPGAELTMFLDAPAWQGQKTIAFGRIRFSGRDEGVTALAMALAEARSAGFTAAIGPMDGDTWHAYRLVTESDGSSPFPLEPVCGPHDLAAFEAAGFSAISRYGSARTTLEAAIGPGAPVIIPGITIKPWDGANAEGLIGQLFDMSVARFAGNAFYKPITRQAFLDLYRPVIPRLDPRLIFFAMTDKGQIVGFLFGYPHFTEPGTVVFKTYASGIRGVGFALSDTFHRAARAVGNTDVIHALMHEHNISSTRSGQHNGVIFRRYALMGRALP